MRPMLKIFRFGASVLAIAVMLVGAPPSLIAFAQTTAPSAAPLAALSESTIKAVQEALNKQGIAVKVDGILTDETRAAIRKYQSQHHLPVTGEPDQATLDKLGVRQSAAADGERPQRQAAATPGMMMGPMMPGGMMNYPMMPGGMAAQGVINCPMMPAQSGGPGMMPSQMQPGQMSPRQMQQGQMPGMAMSYPTMHGQMQAMMQMMQGMMQMMQMMQTMMQSQTPPAPMQPGPMQPGQAQPGAR